jgi:hypothetical protein
MKFVGSMNYSTNSWDLKQIYIDGEPLLDKELRPLDNRRKFKCAIDYFIADGGQGFKTIQAAEKSDIIVDGKVTRIDEVLMKALREAPSKYEAGSEYPSFKIAFA